MILTANDFDAIKRLALTLDCPSMELVPVVQEARERYRGSGYISFGEKGLEFKFFADHAYDHATLFIESPAKAGQIFEDMDYYWLYATDVYGRRWRSSQILPDFTLGSGVVAVGKIAEIQASEEHQLPAGKPFLKLWFLGDLEFPVNQSSHTATKIGEETISESWSSNSATFDCAGYNFFVSIDDGWSTIEASKLADTIPEHISQRIEESIEFMLSYSARAVVVEDFDATGMRASVRSIKQSSLTANSKSPLSRSAPEYRRLGWNLFGCFFRYVESHNGTSRAPLSRILQYIVQMNRAPLDAQALALGVAVEALLKEFYYEVARPPDTLFTELETATSLIQGSSLSATTVSRILGSLRAMKETRAKDRLLVLIEMKVITRLQYNAWSRLRNSTAHAEVHSLDNTFLGLCNSVLALAYSLIFHVIGYQGPFTDYGTPGWPQLTFPIQESIVG